MTIASFAEDKTGDKAEVEAEVKLDEFNGKTPV
jgi:hypothetical protein